MRHRILDQSQLARFDEPADLVHFEGVGQVSTMTLCGAVDWIGADWITTNKQVNCKGCIAVRNHVLGNQ